MREQLEIFQPEVKPWAPDEIRKVEARVGCLEFRVEIKNGDRGFAFSVHAEFKRSDCMGFGGPFCMLEIDPTLDRSLEYAFDEIGFWLERNKEADALGKFIEWRRNFDLSHLTP